MIVLNPISEGLCWATLEIAFKGVHQTHQTICKVASEPLSRCVETGPLYPNPIESIEARSIQKPY